MDAVPLTFRLARTSSSRALLQLAGVVDRFTGGQYIRAAGHALEQTDGLDVDLAAVTSYDAMGLAAFLNVHNMATESAKRVTLVNLCPNVAARLRRTGIYDLLTGVATTDPDS